MVSNNSTIVYSNDGFGMSGVTINENQWTLPIMSIFTEYCESLDELEKSTMKMLSAATG